MTDLDLYKDPEFIHAIFKELTKVYKETGFLTGLTNVIGMDNKQYLYTACCAYNMDFCGLIMNKNNMSSVDDIPKAVQTIYDDINEAAVELLYTGDYDLLPERMQYYPCPEWDFLIKYMVQIMNAGGVASWLWKCLCDEDQVYLTAKKLIEIYVSKLTRMRQSKKKAMPVKAIIYYRHMVIDVSNKIEDTCNAIKV